MFRSIDNTQENRSINSNVHAVNSKNCQCQNNNVKKTIDNDKHQAKTRASDTVVEDYYDYSSFSRPKCTFPSFCFENQNEHGEWQQQGKQFVSKLYWTFLTLVCNPPTANESVSVEEANIYCCDDYITCNASKDTSFLGRNQKMIYGRDDVQEEVVVDHKPNGSSDDCKKQQQGLAEVNNDDARKNFEKESDDITQFSETHAGSAISSLDSDSSWNDDVADDEELFMRYTIFETRN